MKAILIVCALTTLAALATGQDAECVRYNKKIVRKAFNEACPVTEDNVVEPLKEGLEEAGQKIMKKIEGAGVLMNQNAKMVQRQMYGLNVEMARARAMMAKGMKQVQASITDAAVKVAFGLLVSRMGKMQSWTEADPCESAITIRFKPNSNFTDTLDPKGNLMEKCDCKRWFRIQNNETGNTGAISDISGLFDTCNGTAPLLTTTIGTPALGELKNGTLQVCQGFDMRLESLTCQNKQNVTETLLRLPDGCGDYGVTDEERAPGYFTGDWKQALRMFKLLFWAVEKTDFSELFGKEMDREGKDMDKDDMYGMMMKLMAKMMMMRNEKGDYMGGRDDSGSGMGGDERMGGGDRQGYM